MACRTPCLALAAMLVGCAAPGGQPTAREMSRELRVAVLPFRTGGALDARGVFAPQAGTPVPEEVGLTVARAVATRLEALGLRVVDPDLVFGTAERSGVGSYDPDSAARVAGRVGAELVVLGTVSRFRQREGTAWGAQTSASVAYDAALVRVADRTVLARDAFEYTQQSLTENLLDLGWFVEAGGRWMTREEVLAAASRRTAARLAAAAPGPSR